VESVIPLARAVSDGQSHIPGRRLRTFEGIQSLQVHEISNATWPFLLGKQAAYRFDLDPIRVSHAASARQRRPGIGSRTRPPGRTGSRTRPPTGRVRARSPRPGSTATTGSTSGRTRRDVTPAMCGQCPPALGGEQDALAEHWQSGASEHLAFDHFVIVSALPGQVTRSTRWRRCSKLT
jgi:hypothetical protein